MTDRDDAMFACGSWARFCSLGGLAVAALLITPARVHAQRCVGLGCTPRYEASIICCNQLVYTPGVEGVGANRSVACDDYIRNRTTPDERMSICIQIRFNGGICPLAVAPCGGAGNTGFGCGEEPPKKGLIYGVSGPATTIYAGPSLETEVVGTILTGQRIRYTDTVQEIDGQTWYYVHLPGRPAGWIPGSKVACLRPAKPPTHPEYTGTAALAAGARG